MVTPSHRLHNRPSPITEQKSYHGDRGPVFQVPMSNSSPQGCHLQAGATTQQPPNSLTSPALNQSLPVRLQKAFPPPSPQHPWTLKVSQVTP